MWLQSIWIWFVTNALLLSHSEIYWQSPMQMFLISSYLTQICSIQFGFALTLSHHMKQKCWHHCQEAEITQVVVRSHSSGNVKQGQVPHRCQQSAPTRIKRSIQSLTRIRKTFFAQLTNGLRASRDHLIVTFVPMLPITFLIEKHCGSVLHVILSDRLLFRFRRSWRLCHMSRLRLRGMKIIMGAGCWLTRALTWRLRSLPSRRDSSRPDRACLDIAGMVIHTNQWRWEKC